jgi:NADH-quinone oxidoreductase subunit K
MITPTHYLILSILLFAIGIAIVIARRNPLIVLIGIELMLQAVNLALITLSSWFQDWGGQVAVFVIMVIAAVELTVGLGVILAFGQHSPKFNRPRRSPEP